MEEADPVVIGGMVLDIHATPSILPSARSTTPGKVHYVLGGVARNIAECMSELGTRPYMISAVGIDMAGKLLLEHWNSARQSTKDGELTSGVASMEAIVKVVFIDSITFHFRQDFDDLALRTRVLGGIALKLMQLAKKFSLAVVLLNQVTTKCVEGSFQLALALGDSWSHSCTNRVILHWYGNERYAYVDKSPSLRSASAPYSVTNRGIRDSTSNSKRSKLT